MVSEPNYHTTKYFSENFSIRISISISISILEISKTLIYEFWYDYTPRYFPVYWDMTIVKFCMSVFLSITLRKVKCKYILIYEKKKKKPKHQNNTELFHMDTDSFIINIKTKDFYEDIANDVEERFDTSNYEVNRPLPKGKNKKVIGLMKDKLGGNIMTQFAALRPKNYSYIMDDGKNDKRTKGTKKCVIKTILKFKDYKDCLLNNEIISKSQQRFKSEAHNAYTEEVNKIALSSNDDKRLQT